MPPATRSRSDSLRRSKRLNPARVSVPTQNRCYVQIITARAKIRVGDHLNTPDSCRFDKQCQSSEPMSKKPQSSKSQSAGRPVSEREKELLARESKVHTMSQDLDARLARICAKEQEVDSIARRREVQSAFNRLEELLACSLCYEFLACPYSLTSCGHTFCATCILKWFFSRLHDACGAWHEPVHCPICRSSLALTPEKAPRPERTFPFVWNLTAMTILQNQIDCLAFPTPECENTDSESQNNNNILSWKEGGQMRIEWHRRNMEGKKEMEKLAKHWAIMKPNDFLETKRRLDV